MIALILMASVVEGNNIVLIIADDLDVVLDGMVSFTYINYFFLNNYDFNNKICYY